MKRGTFTNLFIYSLFVFVILFFGVRNVFAQTPIITPVPPLCENGAAINLEDFVNDEDFEAAYWPFGTWSQYDLIPASLPGLSGSMLNPSLISVGGPYEIRWREYTVLGGTKVVDERFDFYIIESPTATATNDLLSCFGDSNGEITITASGGTSLPYEYSIDGGSSYQLLNLFTNLTANNYTIVVYDQSCYSDPISASVSQPNQITFTPTVTNVLCIGGNTGEIQVNASGGTPPLMYSIDGGPYQVSNTFSNLIAGVYDIQVRDANLCTSSVTPVAVTQPTAINFTTNVLDVDCFGSSTGEITVNASGGTPSYMYSIDGGGYQASNNFSNLSFGVYEIRVRDANGCISSPQNINVDEPADAVSFIYSVNHVSCNGDNSGSITITPSGGVSPYYYSINGGTNYQASNVFNSLSAGSYNVMIRDANSCETSISVVNINEPALALNFSTTNVNVSCYGGTNGQITVNAVGGTPPYLYSNDNGTSFQSAAVFSALSSGVYNIVVKDAANCVTSTTAVTITQPANELDFTYSQTDVDCYGDASGAISINAVGGTPSYQYSINGGSTYQSPNTFSALAGGNYSLRVKDANGCETAALDIVLDEPAASISFVSSQTNVNCYGDATGEIVVTASGGTPPYQYSRNNGASFQGSSIFSALVAGDYNIVVRDANLCLSSATTVSITQPVAPLDYTTSIQNIDCYGGASGEIVFNAFGGTSSYLFSINGGADYQLSNTFSGLSAGNYDLRVKDANNCITPINTVNISEPLSLVNFTYSTSDVNCFGGADGEIIVSASGGTAPYYYSKNGGTSYQASNVFDNLNAASYDIIVKDANNCVSGAQTVVISQPPTSVNFIYSIQDVLCFGGSSGEIEITASGGTPGYQYSVDNGATYQVNNTFTGLVAGNYYVRVRDAHMCESVSALVNISQPILEISFTNTITNVSCFGGNNGIININATGGTPPYSYSKDGGLSYQTSSVFSGLSAGVYNLIVKDINNCQTAVTTVSINQPAAPISFTTNTSDIDCNGDASGQIIVTAVGGTPPYQFSINAGATFQSSNIFNNLYAGAYSVMVKDINNCTSSVSFVTLTEPSEPVSFTTLVDHVLCFGDMTGEITVNASGGIPNYQYSKNGGVSYQASNVFSNLMAGNYSIIVKDASDCESVIQTITVTQPAASVSFTYTTEDVLCFGGSTGEIELSASGGTGPYQYSIDGGSSYQISNQFTGLTAGNYSARVKDVNNCLSGVTTINVGQPITSVVHSAIVTNVLCYGGSSGAITLNASGGTPGYTYSIDGGVSFINNNIFSGLSAGDYLVMVKDNNGCYSVPTTVTVGEPASAVSFTYSKIDVVCNGDDDGEINIAAFGGTPLYQFSIDGGVNFSSSNHFTGLTGGDYSVLVRDANDCYSAIEIVTILPGQPLSFTVNTTDVSCFGGNTGQIEVTAAGGTPPYVYSKDNGATYQPSNIFTGLAAGIYSILIKDAHDCISSTLTVPISEPITGISANASITNVLCHGYASGAINIQATGGTTPYSYSIDGGNNFQSSPNFSSLPAGNYAIVIRDFLNCTFSFVETISQPMQDLTYNTSLNHVLCFGDASGSIEIVATGGTSSYEYSIDNGINFQASGLFENLIAGDYHVVVKDAHDCTTDGIVSINQPGGPLSFTVNVSDVLCYGGSSGSIEINPQGGTPDYEYSIDNGANYQTSNLFSNLPSGDYQLVVRDANLCMSSQLISVSQPDQELSFTTDVTNVLCYGNATGTINVLATGGTLPYEYSINGGGYQSNSLFENLIAGDYTINVRDANLCQTSQIISIDEPLSGLSFTTDVNNVLCYGESTGSIEILAQGGTSPYMYSINGGYTYEANSLFNNLTAGSYEVQVIDNNACVSVSEIVIITQPSSAIQFSADVNPVQCFGQSNGSIIINASGGTPPYQFSNNNGVSYQSSNSFTNLIAGIYNVIVKDQSNCELLQLIEVTQPDELNIQLVVSNVDCYGGNNGSIEINASGGGGSFQYSIDGGINFFSTNIFENLWPGIYNIMVVDANNCSITDQVEITEPGSLPEVSFVGLENDYCLNGNTSLLTGNQAPNGSFTGPGITDHGNGTATFNPSVAGIGGPNNITYSYNSPEGCFNSQVQSTYVYDLPVVSFGLLNESYCIDYGPVTLTGNHAPDGSFSGIGVFDNGNGTATFDPAAAGVGGPYQITYTYSDGNLCVNSSTQETEVFPLPTVNFTGLQTDYCVNDMSSILIGNHAPYGVFTGLGITDNGNGTASFDPSLAGVGQNIVITYSYTSDQFCINSKTRTVNVHGLPIVEIYNLELNYCLNEPDIEIIGNPLPGGGSDGYFTGEGITDHGDGTATFSPSALEADQNYTITYTFMDINSCENSESYEVNIIDLPNPPQTQDVMVCFGENVPALTATGESGFQIIWYNEAGDSIYSGNTYQTGLTDPGTYLFSVTQIHTVTECESNHSNVSLTINELPDVNLPAFEDVCIYDFIIYLNTGTPAGGVYSGSQGILQMPNGDYIFHPEYAGVGVHDIIYTYTNPITNCQDTAFKTITVHDRPDVGIVDLGDVYCVSGTEVTIHGNHPGFGSFTGPGIVDNGDGSAQFFPNIAGLGNHEITYEYQDINTTCSNEISQLTTVEGIPENVSFINISNPEICADDNGNITLEAIGGDGTWVNWFKGSCNGSSPEILTSNPDSSVIVIPPPSISTYYYAQWETECGVSEICAEDYILVTQIPTKPDTTWVTPNIICNNDQDSVALYIIGGNYGTVLQWTQDSCTGTIVGQTAGEPLLIPTPDTTTKYFARWINDCGESQCTEAISVRVTAPVQEVAVAEADSNYFCVNTLNQVELRAFGGVGDTIIWYYDTLGFNPVPMDSIISINQPRGDTIQIVPPHINTSFYPFRASVCEQVGGHIGVDLYVYNAPVEVDTAYVYPGSVCFGTADSITLIAQGGSGETLEWYAGDCEDGMFIGNGNNYKIPAPLVTTHYYARWTTPCGLSDYFETQVEIYPPTTDPIAIASDTNVICAGVLDEIQLVMIGGSGDSVIWFSDSCGGTPLNGSAFYYQSPNSDTIVIPAPSSDTTFYAYWATDCEVSECVSIDIIVYPQPIVMDTVYANHNNFCSGSITNITLTATGGFGDVISWTSGSCDGPVVAVSSGPSVSIPAPMDTTTYYAKWKTLCDSSECKSIQINVPPSPEDPSQIHIMENQICANVVDSITLVLEGGSGYKAIWYYGTNCGNNAIPEETIHFLSEKGDTIRIPRPSQSLYITANWSSYNNVCGTSNCVTKEVFIYDAPTAYFELSGGEPCESTLLQFDPQSEPGSGLITNLHWDFGDGTIVDTNLQVYQYHQYSQSGIYNVDLIITNTYGCQDTSSLPLEISEGPQALFTYNSSCLGEPVQFSDQSIPANGEIENWFWDFGDASSNNDTSTLQFPSYIYQQPGIYNVTLVVSETGGCQNEIQQQVYVAPSPTAYFQLETASCQSVPVFFNDSSYTNFNAIGTWIWNFGDGSADSVIYAPQSPDVWYTYYTNGDFTVSLTVLDTSGCVSETFYQYFEVRPQPIAGFAFSDTACQTGIIHFYDTSYHEPGTTGEAWSWSFGDGSYAYNQNPVHSYIETGEFYNVQMIITDEYGCQDTVANDIEVKPELEISFSSNLVCEGEPTEFVAQIDQPVGGSVVEWQWFFGDNTDTVVVQDTINHTFSTGGTFYTTLIGVDEGGCETIVINQAVLVNPAPVVDFFIPEASCNDPSIFYDHSIANAEIITNYHFDYGDGTYENFTNENYNDPIHHPYPAGANQYISTITLTNSNSCESTQEFVVERESCITINFNPQYPACVNQEMMFVNSSYINSTEVTIDSIIWNFGDGVIYEYPIEIGDTVFHAYQTTGLKEVKMTLLATNQFGDFATQTTQFIYVNELPNAEFTIDQNLLCSRDSINFRDQSWVFNGDIVGWIWDFGDMMEDNDTSYRQNPQYWYAYSGEYFPILTAISDSGCMNTNQKPIQLQPSPINHLFANVEYGCGPQNEILFRDTAYMESGDVDYHQWIFGFNDTVYTQADSLWHQLNIGEYKVISRVVSEIGCEGIDSLVGFNIFDEPIARFSYYPDDPSIREPEVFFNDQSIGPEAQVLYYHWNFGDNTDTVGLDPVHIYQDTGLFNVVLTIQDENGCVDSITNSLYVDPVFSFYIPNAFSPNGNGLNDEFGPIGSYFDDTYYEFQIYNRWGELLFETKDPHRYWQGDYSLTTKNQVPLGVCSWIIRVEDAMGEEHVYKGMVTVVR